MTSLQPEIIDDRSLCPASTGLVSPPSVSVGLRGNVAIPMLPEPAIDLLDAKPGQTADAGAEAVWRRYYRSGAGDASEEELVTRYLPLVKTVVGRLAMSLPPHVDQDELYSAGLIGLLNALRQFNPKIGTAFEPYARVRIRGAVLDELRRMDWIPRSIHAKARKIQSAIQELEQATGKIPDDAEVAAALGIGPQEYEKWLKEIRPAVFVSLDSAVDDGEELREHEIFSGKEEDPGEHVSNGELSLLIAERIKQLPEMQRKVLALYYYEGLRLNEIAAAFGFCNSHICQIHAKAILAIRSAVEEYELTGATQGRAK